MLPTFSSTTAALVAASPGLVMSMAKRAGQLALALASQKVSAPFERQAVPVLMLFERVMTPLGKLALLLVEALNEAQVPIAAPPTARLPSTTTATATQRRRARRGRPVSRGGRSATISAVLTVLFIGIFESSL